MSIDVTSKTPATSSVLDHEKLDAYRVAVELDKLVVRICRGLGRGHAWLRDQAERASGSTALNLTEAVARRGADRAQRYRIARGSLLECDAALTLIEHRALCAPALREQARVLTVRLSAMLYRLVETA